MLSIITAAKRMKEILGLETEPVAVFLLPAGPVAPAFDSFAKVAGHRYCQLLMRARHGESLRLEPGELACPAAAAAFGFRPLPEGLATGKGLVGFGIVSDPMTGKVMFEGMTRLPPGSLGSIAVCPLSAAPALPDVVVVEGSPEQLMWLALADLNRAGGRRRRGDTAVLQATCVDATIIPHVEQRLNFSLGCYGCREATDLGPGETVLGFPGAALDRIVAALEGLNDKAIARSRAKKPHAALQERGGQGAPAPVWPAAQRASGGVLPQLEGDMMVRLNPEDVTRIFRTVLDGDREDAFLLLRDRFFAEVQRLLNRPHCMPAFEMTRKLKGED